MTQYIVCPHCGEKTEIIVPETMEEFCDFLIQCCEKCHEELPIIIIPNY